jgi:hypothetical protein
MSEGDAKGRAGEVFAAFLKLGLTSFGGPIAHLGYFRNEFVERRKWLEEHSYADLVALCQFYPDRPPARSASPSVCPERAISVRSRLGRLSRCRPR